MTIDTLAPIAPETPAEPTTRIKPSEALRLGRLEYPVRDPDTFTTGPGRACALGAMMAGWGVPLTLEDDDGDWYPNWDGLYDKLREFDLPDVETIIDHGTRHGNFAGQIARTFDVTEHHHHDGDKAVLKLLTVYGL